MFDLDPLVSGVVYMSLVAQVRQDICSKALPGF